MIKECLYVVLIFTICIGLWTGIVLLTRWLVGG
jgi:hypothetical protein